MDITSPGSSKTWTIPDEALQQWHPGQPPASTPPTTPPVTPPPPATPAPGSDFYSQVRLLFPYLPEPLVQVFADAWTTTGSPEMALHTMRQNRAVYDVYFAGNRREDGTLRLSEFEYLSNVEGYKRRLAEFGVPPDLVLTPERQRALIEGEKSPAEFEAELSALYVGVMSAGEHVRAWYADNYGAVEISDAALFASVIDRAASPMEFERRIRASQVGGEASRYGFGAQVDLEEAERLTAFGLEGEGARRLFSRAAQELPALNDLVRRFNDPDDELTVDEFADALVVQDADQIRTIGRLLSRSRAQFGSDELVERDRSGRLTGLRPT
ncbi:MAG TPA: hypothetical protein VM938_10615 [Acidimicrobiales bacterium]|nr:hypothetical protein [Acidimicrobiales bacterium]